MSIWLQNILLRPFWIAKTGLGKFIILAGCLLHLGWAAALLQDSRAAGATPLSAIYYICGQNSWVTIATLITVSALSLKYLTMKAHAIIKPGAFAMLMIPQLWLLSLSFLAGVYASWKGYYIDTVAQPGLYTIVHRPHLFILADQLPVMVLAVLYLIAVVFACTYRITSHGNDSIRH